MPDALAPCSPALLDAAGAAALVGSYAAASKGAALKDIGRIDTHIGRFVGLAPLCLVATVRVAGTARLSVDPELLASMAVQGKEPKCAIVISVRQAYLHCAKALLRSKLWQPDYVQPRGTFPSISRMVGDQIGLSEEDKKTGEARTERAYKDGLWAPIP